MSQFLNRREFIGRTAAAGALSAGLYVNPVAAGESKSPNEKLNIAVVGVAHKGEHNLKQLTSQNIVALCDVDSSYLGRLSTQFPKARTYRDYRKLIEAEHNRIDAVVVSTADHSHAPATVRALTAGKHVYCEKPLTTRFTRRASSRAWRRRTISPRRWERRFTRVTTIGGWSK